MIIIELGCGDKKQYHGSIGVDINPNSAADVIHDIQRGLPFKNNYADMITSSHFMEHIREFGLLMRECHRVLKNGGTFEMTVPYHSNHRSHFPHHMHPGFSWISMVDYFQLCEQYDGIKFRLLENRIIPLKGKVGSLIGKVINDKPYLYDRFFSYVFPSSELYVRALKSTENGVSIDIRKKSVI